MFPLDSEGVGKVPGSNIKCYSLFHLQSCYMGISRYHTVILDLDSVVDMSKINTNACNLYVKQDMGSQRALSWCISLVATALLINTTYVWMQPKDRIDSYRNETADSQRNNARTENTKRESAVTENRTKEGVGTDKTLKEGSFIKFGKHKGVSETLNRTDQLKKDSLFKTEIEKHRLRLYAGAYRHCFSKVESALSLPSEKECTNPRVPNTVHLVWTYEKRHPFKFRQLLSVFSMLQIQKPCAVLFWYAGYMPTGNYWKQFQV